jgi:hypothetical protein
VLNFITCIPVVTGSSFGSDTGFSWLFSVFLGNSYDVNLIKPRPLTHNSLFIIIEFFFPAPFRILISFYLFTVGEESYCCTWSHSLTHVHTVRLLWTLTTQITHERQSYLPPLPLPPAGFKPAIPASEWQQTYASDRTAISLNHSTIYCHELLRVSLNNFGLIYFI